jgi:hypothetical protein
MRTILSSSAVLAALSATVAAQPISLGFERPLAHQPRLILSAAASEPAPAEVVPVAASRDAVRPHGTTIFGLPKNIGPVDRVARAVIGSALVGLGLWGLSSDQHLSDTTSYVLMGVAAVPFATAATGYCPLYQLVGVDYTF